MARSPDRGSTTGGGSSTGDGGSTGGGGTGGSTGTGTGGGGTGTGGGGDGDRRHQLHDILDSGLDLVNKVAGLAFDLLPHGTSTGCPSEVGSVLQMFRNMSPSDAYHAANAAVAAQPSGDALVFPPVAGGSGPTQIHFTVKNNTQQPWTDRRLGCTGLVSADGDRITGTAITFVPPTISVGPGQSVQVIATLKVPQDQAKKHFVGVIELDATQHANAFVAIDLR